MFNLILVVVLIVAIAEVLGHFIQPHFQPREVEFVPFRESRSSSDSISDVGSGRDSSLELKTPARCRTEKAHQHDRQPPRAILFECLIMRIAAISMKCLTIAFSLLVIYYLGWLNFTHELMPNELKILTQRSIWGNVLHYLDLMMGVVFTVAGFALFLVYFWSALLVRPHIVYRRGEDGDGFEMVWESYR